jgi:hypothetical protein
MHGARSKSMKVVACFLPLALGACALGEVGGVTHPTLSGSVIVRLADGSESRWTPDRCVSGDLEYFVGFDFLSQAHDHQLRALLDPIAGPVLRWNTAGKSDTVLRTADCTVLELDVRPTAWRVNDVREFAGHVTLQCQAPDGVRLDGQLSIDHCH